MSLFIALVIAAVQAAPAQGAPVIQVQSKNGTSSEIRSAKDPLSDQLSQATNLIRQGKSADAIPILDQVIAAEEGRNRDKKGLTFSARSMTEALLYATLGTAAKKPAVVLDGTWSGAYFAKGYALVDLNRGEEAKAYLDKAIDLAPMNAQFLAERGEWFKSRKDWGHAFADFEAAASDANFSPDAVKSFEQRRAWRGMAYSRTEQGKLGEARDLLTKCLKLDSTDDKCQHELEYVNGLLAKAN